MQRSRHPVSTTLPSSPAVGRCCGNIFATFCPCSPPVRHAAFSNRMAETQHLVSKGVQAARVLDEPRLHRVQAEAGPPASVRPLKLVRPQSAPASSRNREAGPSKQPREKKFGRMSLYDRQEKGAAHAFQGPKVLRDMERLQHGFPLKGPDEFLKQGDGHSLRTRVRLKELLKKHPVNRDPPFQKGTGGVHLSWESVPSAHSIFRHLHDNGTIDFVSLRWGTTTNEVVWGLKGKRPGTMVWSGKPSGLEVARWLPIFLEGVREYQEPYRFLAIMGSHDLISEAGQKLHEFAADLVPPLKKALDTREPTVVAIATELMLDILNNDPEVAKVWIYYLRDFSQVFNLFLSRNFLINMGYNSHRLQSTKRAIHDVLLLLQQYGGEHAMTFVRKYVRGDPAVTDDTMHRQRSKAEQKPGHGPWKPYLLI